MTDRNEETWAVLLLKNTNTRRKVNGVLALGMGRVTPVFWRKPEGPQRSGALDSPAASRIKACSSHLALRRLAVTTSKIYLAATPIVISSLTEIGPSSTRARLPLILNGELSNL